MATSDARQPGVDTSVRASSVLAGRNAATAAARELLRLRNLLVTAAVLSVVAPVLAGAVLVAAGAGSRAGWCVVVGLGLLLPVQIRTLCLLLPRRADTDGHDPATVVSLPEEPALRDWLSDTCAELGVEAPGRVLASSVPGCRVAAVPETATVLLGMGWFSWLRTPELTRLMAVELSTLRWRDDPTVHRALILAAARDAAAARGVSSRLRGPVVRRLTRALDDRQHALTAAAEAWAVDAVPPRMRATAADDEEASIAEEGWRMLRVRWLLPALSMRQPLQYLAAGQFDLLAGCELHGLVGRSVARVDGPVGLMLFDDGDDVDRLTSDAECAPWADSSTEPVEWSDYVARVTIPRWRAHAAEGVHALGSATGESVPASVASWLDLLDQGWGSAVQAVLERRHRMLDVGRLLPERPDPAEEPGSGPAPGRPHALGGPDDAPSDPSPYAEVDRQWLTVASVVTETICLALVDARVAQVRHDLVWGLALVLGDEVVEPARIEALVATRQWNALRMLFADVGVDVGQPLWLGDSRTSRLDRSAAGFVVGRRLRTHHLVVSDGRLHLYRQAMTWRDRGSAFTDGPQMTSRRLLRRRIGRLVSDGRPETGRLTAIDPADVRDATLVRPRNGTVGRLVLTSATSQLRLVVRGESRELEQTLEVVLGDRLQVVHQVDPSSPDGGTPDGVGHRRRRGDD